MLRKIISNRRWKEQFNLIQTIYLHRQSAYHVFRNPKRVHFFQTKEEADHARTRDIFPIVLYYLL